MKDLIWNLRHADWNSWLERGFRVPLCLIVGAGVTYGLHQILGTSWLLSGVWGLAALVGTWKAM